MRRLFPIFALLIATSVFAEKAKEPEALPPPEMSSADAAEDALDSEPDIRIVKKGSTTLEEYRVNGKLYMIKVTPAVGPSYYLVDETGNGEMVRRNNPDGMIHPPRWVLLRW
jgi:hypothetical protein